MAEFRPMLAAHGLTEQQWRVLRVLDEAGPLAATELAEKAFILAPSLTRILKNLEARKLVSRTCAPGDGRRLMIANTNNARTFIARVLPESEAIYAALEDRYGHEHLDTLLDLLEGLSKQDS